MENNINIEEILKKIHSKNIAEKCALFIWGLLLYAASFTVFFSQYNIVTGGSAGLSLIIKEFININSSFFVFIFSAVILLIGLILLGKDNTIKTIFGVIIFPIFMEFTSIFPDIFNFQIPSLFLTIFLGGIIMGLGNGLILKSGYSTGGFQTIYQILYKYLGLSIGKSTMWINGILIVISGFFFDFTNVLYALIGLYVSSIITDKVMLDISASKTFYIVTDKYKEINEYISQTLGHSVTIMDGRGGYSNENKKVLLCAIPTREYFTAKHVIKDIDKNVFFLITDTYEIKGGM